MKRIFFISLLVVVVCLFLVQNFYINPKYFEGWSIRFTQEYEMQVVYKNSQRGNYLYLHHDSNLIGKFKNLKEFEAFNKPIEGKDIDIVLYTDTVFYDAAKIGDRVKKISNSNMCFLVRNDSIFRYNCQLIPKVVKEEIGTTNEWSESEIGFWKSR